MIPGLENFLEGPQSASNVRPVLGTVDLGLDSEASWYG